MILNLILAVVLIVFIIHNIVKVYKYSQFSGWHNLFVPLYSLLLFFVTMKWTPEDMRMLAALLPFTVLIGWFETWDVRIRQKTSRRSGKPVYEIRRGSPYAFGWTITFVLGIVIHAWQAKEEILNLFSEAIWDNIIEEINPLAIFSTSHTWYIWFLSGVSSIVFNVILRIKARHMAIEHIKDETV